MIITIEYRDFDLMYSDLNKAGYKMRDLHGWLNVERKNGGVHENNYLAIGFSYESRNWHWEILPRDPNGEESMRILEEVIAERMAEGLPKPVPENAFFEKV